MRNNIYNATATFLVLAGMLILAFFGGAEYNQSQHDNGITANSDMKLGTVFQQPVATQMTAIKTVQYVEKPVTKIDYVEQTKEAPVTLRDFANLEELKLWLQQQSRVATVHFQYNNAPVDCDDYAIGLQQAALADGYIMSFQIIDPETYNKLFTETSLPPGVLHAIDLVVIGNSAYYIEPQTGEVVLASNLD